MNSQYDWLLVGGMVVTGAGICRADVGVKGETITAVGANLPRQAAREVVDATGKYVFPGIIDVHVHPVYLDDVEACSRVAAYGGTTTLLHFAYARTGDSLLQKVEEMLRDAQARSRLDFGLHGGMFEAPRQVPEIPRVMELGVRTFKFFLTYLKQGWYTDDYQRLSKRWIFWPSAGGWRLFTAKTAARLITWRTSISKARTHPSISMLLVRRRWKKKASFARSAWPRSWAARCTFRM